MVGLVESFLQTLGPETQRTYRFLLLRLAGWCQLNGVEVGNLDALLFQMFLEEQPGWGANTRRLCACAARAFCRWHAGDKHPMLRYRLTRVKVAPQRHLSRRRAGDLLAALDTSTLSGIRNLALVALALDTGLRAAELAILELERVDLDERRLTALVKGSRWQPKVYSGYTASCVREWVNASSDLRKTGMLFFSLKTAGRGKAWTKQTGMALTAAGIKKIFRNLAEQTGIAFSAHDLRRTMAVLASLGGGARKLVAENAGWASPGMVDYYTRGMELDPNDWERCSPVNWLMGLSGNTSSVG